MKEGKEKEKGRKKDKAIFTRSSLEGWCLLAALAVWAAVANKALNESQDEAGHLFKSACQQIQSK